MRIFLIAAIMAASAWAGVWVDGENTIIDRPRSIAGTANPTDSQLAAHGIREVAAPDGIDRRWWRWSDAQDCYLSAPQAEIDATLSAEAAAAAAAKAAAEAEAKAAEDKQAKKARLKKAVKDAKNDKETLAALVALVDAL